MSKINKILLALVVVLIIALGGIIYWQTFGSNTPYYAVYLDTGDLYFGKLSRFPQLHLSDVWFLLRNPQDQNNPLSVSKFERAFWGPEDKIYLNEKNIVWKAKLKSDSQLLNFIKNPQSPQSVQPQPQQQSSGQNVPQEQSTSTKR